MNAEKLVVAYLSQFFDNVANEMWLKAPLPFYLVARVNGGASEITSYPLIQIDTLARKRGEAGDAADEMHERMCAWKAKDTVTYNGHSYGIQTIEFEDEPFLLDYGDDTLERYVARYKLQLRVDHL